MSVYIDTSIISFYISSFGILGMILFKIREIRSGRKSWISTITNKINDKVHRYYDSVVTLISFINRRSALVFVQWIAYHILSWARNTYIWLYKKAHAHAPSKRVIDMVRGRGEINRNSGSSFYLKSISDKNLEEAQFKK